MEKSPITFKSTKYEYSYMSNFYPDVIGKKCKDDFVLFEYDGRKYRSVEIFYQYKKFLEIGDSEYAEIVYNSKTSFECKQKSSKKSYLEYKDKLINGKDLRTKKSISEEMEEKFKKYWLIEKQKEIMYIALKDMT